MIKNIISKLHPFYDTLVPIWNYRIISNQVISIKLGNIVLAISLFVILWIIMRKLLVKLIFPFFKKKVEDVKTNKLIENLFYLFFGVIILAFSLNILGFSFKVLMSIWAANIFNIKDNPVNLGNLIIGFVILIFGLRLSKYFSLEINKLFQKRMDLDIDTSKNIETLIKYILIIIVILFCLSIVGIPLTAFTIIGGSLAIGVGFGSKELLNNFISGMVLMSEKQHKIGDIIEVENNSGIIEHIGARSTRIRTFDNMRITIPNSKLMENTITNWSLIDTIVRRKVVVGVAYGSPVKKVEKLIMRAAIEHHKIEEKPKPTVLFLDFADSSLVFEVRFWTNFEKPIDMLQIESDLRFRIEELFRKADIEIAFPQLDVHLDSNRPIGKSENG